MIIILTKILITVSESSMMSNLHVSDDLNLVTKRPRRAVKYTMQHSTSTCLFVSSGKSPEIKRHIVNTAHRQHSCITNSKSMGTNSENNKPENTKRFRNLSHFNSVLYKQGAMSTNTRRSQLCISSTPVHLLSKQLKVQLIFLCKTPLMNISMLSQTGACRTMIDALK